MTRTVRLDIRDLPRDPQHYQGQLRTEVIKMANYVRKYHNKAAALVELLQFAVGHVEKNMALEAAPAEEAAPEAAVKAVKAKAPATKKAVK